MQMHPLATCMHYMFWRNRKRVNGINDQISFSTVLDLMYITIQKSPVHAVPTWPCLVSVKCLCRWNKARAVNLQIWLKFEIAWTCFDWWMKPVGSDVFLLTARTCKPLSLSVHVQSSFQDFIFKDKHVYESYHRNEYKYIL